MEHSGYLFVLVRSGLLLCLIKKSAWWMQVHSVKPTLLHFWKTAKQVIGKQKGNVGGWHYPCCVPVNAVYNANILNCDTLHYHLLPKFFIISQSYVTGVAVCFKLYNTLGKGLSNTFGQN